MPIPVDGVTIEIFGKDLVWYRFLTSNCTALWNSGTTDRRLNLSRKELEIFINRATDRHSVIWHGRDDSTSKWNCFEWPWLNCLINAFEDTA